MYAQDAGNCQNFIATRATSSRTSRKIPIVGQLPSYGLHDHAEPGVSGTVHTYCGGACDGLRAALGWLRCPIKWDFLSGT